MNSGFQLLAGRSATERVAAWANRLDAPVTKASNVYRGLRAGASASGGALRVGVGVITSSSSSSSSSSAGGGLDGSSSPGRTSNSIWQEIPTVAATLSTSSLRKRVSNWLRTNGLGTASTS